jgi:hypothetical protein
MTLTFTTTMNINPYGDDTEVEISFAYSVRHKELVIEAVIAKIEGTDMPVWHLLSQQQRAWVEERCMDHHRDCVQEALEVLHANRDED